MVALQFPERSVLSYMTVRDSAPTRSVSDGVPRARVGLVL